VAAVLDWEWAHAASPLFDLAILLRGNQGAPLPPGFAEAVANGYRTAGGHLPDEWRRATRLVDLVNLCEFLSAPGQDASTTMIAAIRRLVQSTVDDLAI